MKSNILFLIPARRGSKGLVDKNIKILKGKPLIEYSIDFALKIKRPKDKICVSSDDNRIEKIILKYKDVDFLRRPKSLSTDYTSMEEVIMHSIKYFEYKKHFFKSIVLLQPTSPLRKKIDFLNIKKIFNENIDMVVSVKISKENPYFLLYEENKDGFLKKSKNLDVTRRQDAPIVYCLNGSFFMINVDSIKKKSIQKFDRTIKYQMPSDRSFDIDNEMDWNFLNLFMEKIKRNLN